MHVACVVGTRIPGCIGNRSYDMNTLGPCAKQHDKKPAEEQVGSIIPGFMKKGGLWWHRGARAIF
jgi:hypothetical protein